MFRTSTLILLLIYCSSTNLFGQSNFFETQNSIFSASEKQWLISEYKRFDLTPVSTQTLSIIENAKSSSREYLRIEENLDEQSIHDFESLYFPDGKNDRFLQLVSICHLYFPLVEKKLSNASLQRSWKYLPLLMSGYNQHYSNTIDRTGLFAMEYVVAQKYGLRIDTLVDERRGGDITIDAAIKHLKWLNQLFEGDERSIQKAWYVSVPFAKAQAIKTGNESLEQQAEQFTLFYRYTTHLLDQCVYQLPNKLTDYFDILGTYEPFAIKDTIPIEALENVLGCDPLELRNVNPVFVGKYLDPNYRKTSFLINKKEIGKIAALETKLYAYQPAPKVLPIVTAAETIETEQKIYHIVKRGESLGVIARKNKVSISELKKWNKLKSDKIRYGQKLIIYKKVRRPKPKPDPELENPNIDPTAVPEAADATIVIDSIRPDSVIKPIIEKPTIKPEPKQPKDKTVYYKVKSGDTLWVIAKKYKVTPEQIMKWNKIGEKIRPGQRLKIITK